MQGSRKSGKQALNLTEEMVYEMNRSFLIFVFVEASSDVRAMSG